MDPIFRERRRAPRAPSRSLLGYSRRIDEQRFGILGIGSSIDLSASGIRFLAYEAIPLQGKLELELVLEGRPARINDARVVRVLSRRDGAYEVAATFGQVDPSSRGTIAHHVEEIISGERLAG